MKKKPTRSSIRRAATKEIKKEESDFEPENEESDGGNYNETPKKKRSRKSATSSATKNVSQTKISTQNPRSRASTRRSVTTYASDDSGSSCDRPQLTSKGGYSHTKSSKRKIGKANKGKKPWNKGRQRSAADRAKISAGVRARNRIALLKKLEKLGMTEEEYIRQKKDAKNQRENIRRRKVAEKKRMEKNLKKVPIEAEKQKKQGFLSKKKDKIRALISTSDALASDLNSQETTLDKLDEDEALNVKESESAGIFFSREFIWDAHPFDSKEVGASYDDCPSGGDGGLICCKRCTAKYSRFLSHTTKDMEKKTIQKIGREVHEIYDLLQNTNIKLQDAIEASHSNTSTRSYLKTNASCIPTSLKRNHNYSSFDPSMTSILDVCAP